MRAVITSLFFSMSAALVAPAAASEGIRRATLEGGLRVVLAPEADAPTAAVTLAFDAGSRTEARGEAGFTLLLERLFFQGSRRVAPGEHLRLVGERGGLATSEVTRDATFFVDRVPREHLPLALWLEAERVRSLRFTQEAFESERVTLRARAPRDGRTLGQRRLRELVFGPESGYGHPSYGATPDLDSAPLAAIARFHGAHFGDASAVLAIAGGFDEVATLALVRTYFAAPARLPLAKLEGFAAPAPMFRDAGVETSEDRASLHLGWAVPSRTSPDHAALEIAAAILAGDDASRLPRSLVFERTLAHAVTARTEGHAGDDLFEITIDLAKADALASAERAVERALAALAKDGPSEAELDRAKVRARAARLSALGTTNTRARKLAEAELFAHEAFMETDAPISEAVTASDVRRVVARYLAFDRRARVAVKPPYAP